MRPAARAQAAINLLDEIIIAARDNGGAADQLASAFFKARRYAGSKDRRAVRELVWNAIRRFGERPISGRAALVAMADDDPELAECFDGSQYGPAVIDTSEPRAVGGFIPDWIDQKLPDIFDEADKLALLGRASLDVRVNISRSGKETNLRDKILIDLPEGESLGKNGIRLPTGFAVSQLAIYRDGLAEIQDFGSQLIVEACGDLRDKKILDLCAGAGGKTLALLDKILASNPLNIKDSINETVVEDTIEKAVSESSPAFAHRVADIVSTDVNRGRLSKIIGRQARLMGVDQKHIALDVVRKILLNPGKEFEMLAEFDESFDIVLVDAPCSGAGTWRRNPETRWRLNPERLEQVKRQQARVMDIAQRMTKKGGVIIYAVCSILEEEGPGQVKDFLSRNDNWKIDNIDLEYGRNIGDGIVLTPHRDGCDGFFFARLEKL